MAFVYAKHIEDQRHHLSIDRSSRGPRRSVRESAKPTKTITVRMLKIPEHVQQVLIIRGGLMRSRI